jgi:two-component system, chemotaxis family, chemotaxis protein CheY
VIILMDHPRILSVGQCAPDHGKISRALRRSLGAEVRGADTFDEALRSLRSESFDLVLVNRITDADFARGIDLVRALKADPDLAALPVMLVSDLPEAQNQAVALGALPGFGKSALSLPQTLARLRAALNVANQGGG